MSSARALIPVTRASLKLRLSAIVMVGAAAAFCAATVDPVLAERPRLPDAEIFAANTTAVITDPADPRLDARLVGFKRTVKRIIRRHGGRPRGSQLLDGVFFSSLLGITTFQRARDFDIDHVSRAELRDIAERVRRRFHQQSVLTFDYAERRRRRAPAVEVEVPGVSAERVREGFVADEEARQRLQGGSVTLDGRLTLIAARQDLALVERFVAEIGGDFDDAAVRRGRREFVTPASSRAG